VGLGKQGGVSLTAAISSGRGSADGSDVINTNTHVDGGNQVSLTSGSDTTLGGAVITGRQVIANVGNNLTIESLQDTSDYKSQQKSIGGGISIPIGAGSASANFSASKSNIDSTYASVVEQSGIRAGDNGFQVGVAGNTNLTGGVIASTDQAVTDNKNTFTTAALTTSDIQNRAEYSANAVGVSLSGNSTGAPTGAGAGIGSESGNANSVTQSGISGIAANTSVRTTDEQTGIQKIFDAQSVQKNIDGQVTITKAFGAAASNAVATYAVSRQKDLLTQARAEPDLAKSNALIEEANTWAEGGSARVTLHAVVGGLTGGVSGAAGAGAVAAASPSLADLQTKVVMALENNGVNASVARIAGQFIAETTAAGIGAAASGGSVAGTATALNTDTNNRQLHPDEKQRIKQLAGKDANKEARLTAAACALVKCYAEYPVDSVSYQQLKQLADIGASDALSGERQLLSAQTGMFSYTTNGMWNDKNIDAAKKLNNTYQIGTRALGVAEIAGGAATVVVSSAPCATGIGCVVSAAGVTLGADIMYGGSKQLISGNTTDTFLSQGLKGLGMSPEAVGLVEMGVGMGTIGKIPASVGKLAGAVAGDVKVGGTILENGVKVELTISEQIGMLRDIAKNKGNFGLGNATMAEADVLGKSWVGEGYKIARDGSTLVSSDGLRTYRPPSPKNSPQAITGVQANFEQLEIVRGRLKVMSNAHLDITK
jgi:filamentous hemagglutinin